MRRSLNIALICPRYRAGVAGGAESLIRGWAEHLSRRGHRCHVLTTRARNNVAWANELEPGTEVMDGIDVSRFDIEYSPPPPGTPSPVHRLLETPSSPQLQNFISRHRDEYDCFIFAPYLFGLTGPGIETAGEKSVLVPCLHDEPGAYLDGVRKMFARAGAVLFNSVPEQRLASTLFSFNQEKSAVIGMGIAAPQSFSGSAFREKFGIKRPFILYAGRREPGKGIELLLEYFRTLLRYRDPEIDLVLIGSGEVQIGEAERGRIHDLGFVSEADKWNAYAAADIFCQPSTNESFSIVLLEAWLASTAALVSAHCPVTVQHCRQSGGGLFFADYPEFEETIWYLRDNPEKAADLAAAGKTYVEKNYRWEPLLERMEAVLEKLPGRADHE